MGQRSSQRQRSKAGRDIGDAMSRCPQCRCTGLAAPEDTELRLADRPHRDPQIPEEDPLKPSPPGSLKAKKVERALGKQIAQ